MPSHKLSILKSIIWRILGVFVLAAVTYFYTRHWITTTYITFIHHAVFLVIFYLHDRAYLKIKIDNHKLKSIIKAFTYEIILGMGIGGLIVFLFTGSWKTVTRVTGTYTIIKLVMYYINEKIWNKILC